jgi:hypothetical protein
MAPGMERWKSLMERLKKRKVEMTPIGWRDGRV